MIQKCRNLDNINFERESGRIFWATCYNADTVAEQYCQNTPLTLSFAMKKAFILLFFLFLLPAVAFAADWKIVDGKITTRFANDVDPNAPLPEYPRPQMERDTWLNLNGLWDYAITDRNSKPENYDGKILVPYPIESALSGVGKRVGKDKNLHYKRMFTIPGDAAWTDQQILLHFGAVDWETTVFVNGKEVGKHVGGYTPFCLDITDALKSEGEQELTLVVWDPTTDGYQPIGKQHNNPHGIWYTPVTGIWQTVWLEPVPATSIARLKMVPNISNNTLSLEALVRGSRRGDRIRASVVSEKTERQRIVQPGLLRERFRSQSSARVVEGETGRPLVLRIQNPTLWTPDNPHLYDLKIELVRGGKVIDTVNSYFGMREISLGKCENGFTRMMLNGKFLFQHGPLDQGWWPDGLYTAPTDEALAYDLEVTKQLGFNMLRKHVKVEPARFYYHCDRLGVLVWQDMPSGDPQHYISSDKNKPDANRSPEAKENFEREWKEIIEFLYNQPSIVVWVPFNEGWGQYDTCRILSFTKELDPTRLVDGPSGWTDRNCGDIHDIHQYRGPAMPQPEENRAIVLGEYGGLGLPIEGHTWLKTDKNWGYGGNLKDKDDLLGTYHQLNVRLHPMIGKGLSAAVYTQTTDVEIEVNGLMTYDRAVIKVDVEKFKASNDALQFAPPAFKMVIPTAREKSTEWSYTTEYPGDGWERADFDASAWKKGSSGFGQGAPNTINSTEWRTNNIWIRRLFELSAEDASDPASLILDLYYDEDSEVFINGVKVLEVKGYTTDYQQFPMSNVGEAVKTGTNVMAIHCKQTGGGQYIDAGLSRQIPPNDPAKRMW